MSAGLELTVGSARDFDVYLLDSEDAAENISGATDATVAIREYVGADTDILLRDTDSANLTIDTANSKLTASLSQVEADALVAGRYIGEAAVKMASGKWFHTEPFIVDISAQGVNHL